MQCDCNMLSSKRRLAWQCFVVLGGALVYKVGVGHEIEMAKALSIGGEHACRPAS